MTGIGTDIIEVSRIKKSLTSKTGDRFQKRLFTQKEIDYCESKMGNRFQHYAGRFAAKEALLKALGTGLIGKMGWTNISVEKDNLGKPFFHFSGEVKKHIGKKRVLLSISHIKSYAQAFVVIGDA